MCVSLLDSETLAALGAATGEHGTTTLGGHTGTEAMGLGTLTRELEDCREINVQMSRNQR